MSQHTAVGVGAERGLDAALCRRFAAEGYHVLIPGRTAEKIEKVARTIKANNGSAARTGSSTSTPSPMVYWHIHRQPRSAWTQELDLRPYKEPF